MTDINVLSADKADESKQKAPEQEKEIVRKDPDLERPASIAEKSETKPKAKPSEWTEVTGQTLEQLKEKAKVNYDKLSGKSSKKDGFKPK